MTMDIRLSSAYLRGMFARLVAMLAVLAVTVVATVASAHAARMSVEPDPAVHVGETMQAPDNGELSCDGEQHCGSADAGLCEFVCVGLSAPVSPPGGEAGHDYRPASHDLPTGATLASRVPGLSERPPRLRLL